MSNSLDIPKFLKRDGKRKKFRKPLTEEQRNTRIKSLVKARAAKPDAKNISIHIEVRNLPDEHPVSLKKVRSWIKINKEERDDLRKQLRIKYDKKVNNRYGILDVYVRNMESYLKTGVWVDLFYGLNQEFKISYRVIQHELE
tara:strand:- start:280 stop:705 length:426 start_codon:yes stop_codon:yes gene_type:complete